MTHENDALDEVPERSGAHQRIEKALTALGIDPDGGGAIERPAIAAGRLLAAAEILARVTVVTVDDPDGRKSLDDLMHGFYGTVVAFANSMPIGTSSGLRGALLADRLRRVEKQATLSGGEADTLVSALGVALAEARRLQAKDGIL